MVHLHIYTPTEGDALDICRALIREKFCVDCKVETNRLVDESGLKVIYEKNALSKFPLFQQIERYLRDHFSGRYTDLFSLPIVNLNGDKGEQIPLGVEKG